MAGINYQEVLEQLRERYQNNEVSPFIGAGFSKNVSKDMFMSWDELLFDMVVKLYEHEIQQSFDNHSHTSHCSLLTPDTFGTHQEKMVKEIIRREGYLNIVSQYIEHKGYREAVEVYIEERIPSVSINSNKLFLPIKSQEKEITDEDISLHKQLLEGHKWGHIYTTNYDTLLEYVSCRHKLNYTTITERHQLSFSATKQAIIKLHGDLSCANAGEFQFDNNYSHRYIISKEDYEEYPCKHEPFTQLMRITLLKGALCLFGFSGDDPNFVSWIKWVKDILVTAPKNGDIKKFKIFLITIDDKEPSKDKQLFYDNHNIVVIPIRLQEVRAILCASNDDDFKQLLSKMFRFLYRDSSNYYSSLWDEVYEKSSVIPFGKPQPPAVINEDALKKIDEVKTFNRLVKYSWRQDRIAGEIYSSNIIDINQAKLFIYALKDTYLNPQYYPDIIEKIEGITLPDNLKVEWEQLKVRYQTLKLDKTDIIAIDINDDHYKYERVLRLAFMLDFDELREALEQWQPKGHYIQKKAIMLSMFDKEQAKDILIRYLDSNPIMIERYYATELLNRINGIFSNQYPVEAFQNMNLDGLKTLTKIYLDKALEQKNELKPYGWSGTISYTPSNSKYENSTRLLQFFIESGVNIQSGNCTYIDNKQWYRVFKELFIYFPYPALFYSIQCSDSDVLVRIGQDYAYEDKVQNDLPNIQKILLSYISSDTKEKGVNITAILKIAQELFIAVAPAKWEKQFMKIWRTIIIPNIENIESHNEWCKFINKGLKHVSNKTYITEIISDCLDHRTVAIDYLYNLEGSRKKTLKVDAELRIKIDLFVSEISKAEDFTIAGNIYTLLSVENIIEIALKIKELQNHSDMDYNRLYSISYFAAKSNQNINVVKSLILNHPKLWDNGLLETGGATSPSFIKLSQLGSKIKWTRKNIIYIYEKLKDSFGKLRASSYFTKDRSDDIFSNLMSNVPLLDEMHRFLIANESILSDIKGYEDIAQNVYSELVARREFVDISEALLSDSNSTVVAGLNQLYRETNKDGFQSFESEINFVIDMILLKKRAGLLASLEYAEHYLKKYYLKNKFTDEVKRKYLLILKSYRGDTLRGLDVDVPNALKWLVSMSDLLMKNGVNSEDIDYWQEFKKSKRYNVFG